MTRKSGRHPEKQLSARGIATITEPGKYMDGNGLFLRVTDTGAKQWVQRLVIQGRRRDIGHGAYPLVSLAEARGRAFEFRKTAREGKDPYAEIRKDSPIPTFAEAAAAVIELNRPTWSNPKHVAQWESTLKTYVFPRFGKRPVDSIASADVLAVLTPIWNAKSETAKRIRQRIGNIMDWAVAQGYRQDNPAAALTKVLPKRDAKHEHMKALPYSEVATAIATIRASDAYKPTVLCFEFLVLTAARSGEGRGATWNEIDLEVATWTVPASRMKAGREHRVPLSKQALAVLDEASAFRTGEDSLIFPSQRGKPLSDSTISKLCRENGINAVPHGFRSSFRDWASEKTNAPHAVMVAALAHTISNQVEAAYHRTDLFDRRRKLMDSWADYLAATPAKVVKIG